MKQKSLLFTSLLCLALFWMAASKPVADITPTSDAIKKYYVEGLNEYQARLQEFNRQLASKEANSGDWQTSFRSVRRAYKRIEFLLAYLDEESNRDFLNGPPLPWVNRVIAEVEVVEPMGMQIIEEHLYAEDAAANKAEIQRITTELIQNFKSIRLSQMRYPLTDRQIMEAIRAGILRITALGITGFDTPGAGESLPESAISMDAMRHAVSYYLPHLPPSSVLLADSIKTSFDVAIFRLGAGVPFESFDRLNLIRDCLEPLYGQILQLQLSLGIETIYQTTSFSQAVNYLSPHMFSEGVLNDHYYSGIGAQVENMEAIALGRMLFFDPVLSANNERACASCHRPELAFTDGLPKSKASTYEGFVDRNSPTLINSVFADKYFYDLRSDRLENQAEHVIFNPKEFNTTYYDILSKLEASDEYGRRFKEAFGKPANIQDISRALAAYVRSLQSFNSPVDRYLRGDQVQLSAQVQQGFNLFMGKALCGTCHFAPVFSGLVPPYFTENESEVIGVPADPKAPRPDIDPDPGRYDNGRPRDRAPHLKHS